MSKNAVNYVSDLLVANRHMLVDYTFPTGSECGDWIDLLWMFDIVDEPVQQIKSSGRQLSLMN